jgi:ABC-type uncharacterized transport system involved in gliding motility auxiliary subunit
VAVAHDQVRTDVSTSNFVHASGQSWAVGYQAGAAPQFVRGRDRQGPISLGMACERFREFPEPGHAPLAGRLVVIGDSDFITDRYVDMAGNMNLFLNAVDWLAGRQDLISVRPKVADVRMLDLTARQSQVVFWLSVVVVPGGTVLAGVSAMVRRRRRA